MSIGLAKIRVAPGGTLWPKNSNSTKLLHIVLCYAQGVVAYDPVLFWGCILPNLTHLKVKPEALILISIGGGHYNVELCTFFMFIFVAKIYFYHQLWNWQVKRLIKQHKKLRNVSFLYLKISLNMWQAIHSLGWPRSGWPLSSTLCYKFVTGVNNHTDGLLFF